MALGISPGDFLDVAFKSLQIYTSQEFANQTRMNRMEELKGKPSMPRGYVNDDLCHPSDQHQLHMSSFANELRIMTQRLKTASTKYFLKERASQIGDRDMEMGIRNTGTTGPESSHQASAMALAISLDGVLHLALTCCKILQRFTHCRTMIYGYNSKLSGHGADKIRDYGQELIEETKKMKRTKARPLFFIPHSLGGIILAHCLIKAVQMNEDDRPTIKSLHRATYGILLFATPHKGLLIKDILYAPGSSDPWTQYSSIYGQSHEPSPAENLFAPGHSPTREARYFSQCCSSPVGNFQREYSLVTHQNKDPHSVMPGSCLDDEQNDDDNDDYNDDDDENAIGQPPSSNLVGPPLGGFGSPAFLPPSLLDQHHPDNLRRFAPQHIRRWTDNFMVVHVGSGHGNLIMCEVHEIEPEGDHLLSQNQYWQNLEPNWSLPESRDVSGNAVALYLKYYQQSTPQAFDSSLAPFFMSRIDFGAPDL